MPYNPAIYNKSPDEAAAMLLEQYHGIQRNAESAAWAEQKGLGSDSYEFKFWRMVALSIVNGTETPKVQRRIDVVREYA